MANNETDSVTPRGGEEQWRYAGKMEKGQPDFNPDYSAFFVHQSGEWNLNLTRSLALTESGDDQRYVTRAKLMGPGPFTKVKTFDADTTESVIFEWADFQVMILPHVWQGVREDNERDHERIGAMLMDAVSKRVPA